ncbi:phosphonate ABC transporter ATP-binding protein [Prosthecodimorpha staleyi]|uniref:ATP-binding cassette domain-containing protein n=1 Tax=Prosthecodimorpha staleyi TaxID=2840188 RepID=A0A947D8P3_9HYPH|nr:ATP-binding cassette domain-containing protein [Prosthecodimorpha staleyi]MBT9293175.1 ATP-binding cassette domain-containing protein [Prosthecodimorpha staleyi]
MAAPQTHTAAESTPDELALDVRGLVKRFGDRSIFDGVDLAVRPGEAVGIIGANGTGKSTLLRCLVRLTEPDAGSVRILDRLVTGCDARALRRIRAGVGFVFQRHNLVGRLSALSNVVHGVQSRMSGPRTWSQALAPEKVRREALECLDQVGLADRALQAVSSLSGGQSQRVAVARMLMQQPRLILADEPDASLDPKSGAEIMALLFRISRDTCTPLVFVSHHMEHVVRFADRVVGLEHGRISLNVPVRTVDPERLKRFFSEPGSEGRPQSETVDA